MSRAPESTGHHYGLSRAFWALWTTVLVLSAGRFVAPLLASWLSSDRHLDATRIGLVTATYGVGGVVASIAGGYLADRFGRLVVIAGGQLASAVLLVLLARPHGVATLSVLLFVYGVVSFLPNPALSSLVTERASPRLRERAYSLYVWALNCGFAIGPLFASWLASASFALVFYLEAVLLVAITVGLVPTLRERPPLQAARVDASTALPVPPVPPVPPASPVPGPRSGQVALWSVLGTLGRDRVLMVFTAVMSLYLVVYQQGTTTLPVVMSEAGFSVPSYGVLLAINGVVLCLLQLPLVRVLERLPKTVVLVWAVVLTAAGYLVQAVSTQWWHYAVAVTLWTVGELGIFPVASTIVADIAPPRLLATYQGFYGISWPVARIVASVAGGLLLTALGARGLWLVCIVTLAGILVALLASRHERETRERAGRDAAHAELVTPALS